MKNVIFLAPPAAGKGTFSEYLTDKYGYQHISTGDLLRDEAITNKELASKLLSGSLIDDAFVMKLVSLKLRSLKSSDLFILDGVPRTLEQAKALESLVDYQNLIVVYLDVHKDILLKRVLGRLVCPNCDRNYNLYFKSFCPKKQNHCDDCGVLLEKRTDDTEEAFLKRYQQYVDRTKPILDFYEQKDLLIKISNNKEDQTEALRKLMEVVHDN